MADENVKCPMEKLFQAMCGFIFAHCLKLEGDRLTCLFCGHSADDNNVFLPATTQHAFDCPLCFFISVNNKCQQGEAIAELDVKTTAEIFKFIYDEDFIARKERRKTKLKYCGASELSFLIDNENDQPNITTKSYKVINLLGVLSVANMNNAIAQRELILRWIDGLWIDKLLKSLNEPTVNWNEML